MLLLSHTNVAKNEILDRFVATGKASPLQGRPHFIGTIHSFVNTYLTEPYLRSIGHPVRAIDTEIANRVRRKLYGATLWSLRSYLEETNRKPLDSIRVLCADLTAPFGEKIFDLAGKHTATYQNAAKGVRESIELGYLRHDEVFVFANAYIDRNPEIVTALRERFPFVIVDEMQDTSKEQADLLSRIFPRTADDCTIQRVGDSNQAIYGKQENGFPAEDSIGITDSYRFDNEIARLASPFAYDTIQPDGLVGRRRSGSGAAKNTVIVFQPKLAIEVLKEFGNVCFEAFTAGQLKEGKIAALGARHSVPEGEQPNPAHFPKIIADYFPDFTTTNEEDATLQRTLTTQALFARNLVRESGALFNGAESIASAVLSCTNNLLPTKDRIRVRTRKLKQLIELLADHPDLVSQFRHAMRSVLDISVPLDANSTEAFATIFKQIVRQLSTLEPPSDYFQAADQAGSTNTSTENTAHSENRFTFRAPNGTDFDIEVSTIHKAKGETHLATLVLDTFNRTRLFSALSSELYGTSSRRGGSDESEKRLKQAFVGMTRPTHLLAVAVSERSLGKDERGVMKAIAKLEENGWNVRRIQE